jgi:hypothetical protein
MFNSGPPCRASDRNKSQNLPESKETEIRQLQRCYRLVLVFAGVLCSHLASLGLLAQTASDMANKDLREDVRSIFLLDHGGCAISGGRQRFLDRDL